jgi:hypothetical protein
MYGMWIARRSPGGTGQPGRQLKGRSPGVSGLDTVAENAGAADIAGAGLALGVAWREVPRLGWADGAFVADAVVVADTAVGCRTAVPPHPAARRAAAPTAPIDITCRMIMTHRL